VPPSPSATVTRSPAASRESRSAARARRTEPEPSKARYRADGSTALGARSDPPTQAIRGRDPLSVAWTEAQIPDSGDARRGCAASDEGLMRKRARSTLPMLESVTDTPVPPARSGTPPQPGPPAASERLRVAWQRRHESDYIFSFATALGWSLLTCGIYSYYIFFQLMRRSRDHNHRRWELLDAATSFAWEQAQAQGSSE
jgi:hypothetical protein